MTRTYRLPDQLGGATVPGTPTHDGGVKVTIDGLGDLIIRAELLTEIVAEPPVGSVVLDTDGDAWHHKEQGMWFFGSNYCTWNELVSRNTELVPVPGRGPVVTTDRFDLAAPIPATIVTVLPNRTLLVDLGKHADQVLLQVQEGEFCGRAAILDLDGAERTAWTILRIVAESRAMAGGAA